MRCRETRRAAAGACQLSCDSQAQKGSRHFEFPLPCIDGGRYEHLARSIDRCQYRRVAPRRKLATAEVTSEGMEGCCPSVLAEVHESEADDLVRGFADLHDHDWQRQL